MRVLGVDPGLTRCGLGVVDGTVGRTVSAVAYDVVRTSTSDDIGTRLLQLEQQLQGWLQQHRPDVVAVERVFAQHNVRTVMGTAQAAAVAITCAARVGVPVALHTPSEVKAAVTGNGRADKAQVTAMVTRVLRLPAPPRPADTADALALAICQVWRGGMQRRLQAAVAAARGGGGGRGMAGAGGKGSVRCAPGGRGSSPPSDRSPPWWRWAGSASPSTAHPPPSPR